MALETARRHPRVERLLRRDLAGGRVAHAYLFLGAQGVGRADMARRFARAALCRHVDAAGRPCDRCESCRHLEAGTHPDCREVGVPDGRQTIPISAVRDIQALSALSPRLSTARFFLILGAERLTPEAANCFLKTLEEPPGSSVFVLVAASLRALPQTIVSRCRIIRFGPVPISAIAENLRADGVEPEEAQWLALRSMGSPGAAEAFRREGLYLVNRELTQRLDTLILADNLELSDWLGAAAASAGDSPAAIRTALQDMLESVALYYRDRAAALQASPGSADLLGVPPAGHGGRSDAARRHLAAAAVVVEAIERIGANANRQITLDHMFTELALLAVGGQ
jgi:DNA polymerase-3 subunit delta'